MSDDDRPGTGTPAKSGNNANDAKPAKPGKLVKSGAPGTSPGPQPEEIRFFGTTWVAHDGAYGLRRAAVAVGALLAAAAGAFALWFGFQGLQIAEVGGFVDILVLVMFAICGVIAFRKTWDGFTRRPTDPAREDALRGLKTIGFIGSLLAYFCRALVEAPGEGLRRTEYETALVQYDKRRAQRTGNPSSRKKKR